VLAADDEQRRQGGPRSLDTDGNGEVSLQEFQNSPRVNIEHMDDDSNGVLTIDEFLNNQQPGAGRRGRFRSAQGEDRDLTEAQIAQRQEMLTLRVTARFSTMDVNGDEIVTADEYLQGVFAAMDQNQDGVLSGNELRRRGGPRRGRDGGGRGQK